jgi:cytochrome c553
MSPAGAQEADAAAGAEYYENVCSNCHGPTAKGMASFPKLVGHDADFLVMRLEQYRGGEKVGANTALMAPVAADLTDADIANLVAFIVGELN